MSLLHSKLGTNVHWIHCPTWRRNIIITYYRSSIPFTRGLVAPEASFKAWIWRWIRIKWKRLDIKAYYGNTRPKKATKKFSFPLKACEMGVQIFRCERKFRRTNIQLRNLWKLKRKTDAVIGIFKILFHLILWIYNICMYIFQLCSANEFLTNDSSIRGRLLKISSEKN